MAGMMARTLGLCVGWPILRLGAAQEGSVSAFDDEEARMFASLSQVSYCNSLEHVMDWTCIACDQSKTRLVPGKIQVIDEGVRNATRILVGRLRDQPGCLLSFRGSSNIENWVRDLQFLEVGLAHFADCDGCRVHSGFYAVWMNVRDAVEGALREVGCAPGGADNHLYITGHSLGAALTHLAMFFLDRRGFRIERTYSFEAPRVGNRQFSDAFTERFGRKFPVFRVTHYKDPYVHLPPEALGYMHVQTEVYYNETGGHLVCEAVEDTRCANQFRNVLDLLLFHVGDHCGSPLVPNRNICNPECGVKDTELLV